MGRKGRCVCRDGQWWEGVWECLHAPVQVHAGLQCMPKRAHLTSHKESSSTLSLLLALITLSPFSCSYSVPARHRTVVERLRVWLAGAARTRERAAGERAA